MTHRDHPSERYLTISKVQFDKGWFSYHPGQIPNRRQHPYRLIKITSTGLYVVVDERKHEQ